MWGGDPERCHGLLITYKDSRAGQVRKHKDTGEEVTVTEFKSGMWQTKTKDGVTKPIANRRGLSTNRSIKQDQKSRGRAWVLTHALL